MSGLLGMGVVGWLVSLAVGFVVGGILFLVVKAQVDYVVRKRGPTWLLPATNKFPRAQRHTFTRRLLEAAFDLRERLEEANMRKGRARLERLDRADEALTRVRLYLRLATRWGWLSKG